jgi:hypothetical protein
VKQKTNGLAIASLVCGIVAAMFASLLIGGLAVVFGAVARRKISRSNGGLKGNGMALAGIILGAVGVILWLVFAPRIDSPG